MDKLIWKVLAFAIAVYTSTASAVAPRVYQLGDGGAVAPHIKLEFGNDNNPLRSDDGSEEAMFLRLQPSVSYLVQRRNNRLELGYTGDFFQYFEEYCRGNQTVRPGDCLPGAPSFDSASYQNHNLFLNGFLEISSRLRANLELRQFTQAQPLGTGQSSNRNILNALTSPEEWRRGFARAELAYGAAQARGQVRVGLTVATRSFESERGDFDNLNETEVSPNVRLLYRIGTRTQVFGGLGFGEVTGGDSERDISRQTVGIELDTSAITSGSLSFSNVTEEFAASNNRRSLNFIGWQAELTWKPRRFSTVTLTGGRQTERGLFNDDIGLTTNLEIDWEHFWRDRFSTQLAVGLVFNTDVDEFSDLADAEDDTVTARLEANYNIRRWLDIGGFIEIDSRNGRDIVNGVEQSRDFGRTLIGVTANGTI